LALGIFVGLSTLDVVYQVDEFPAANSKIVARSQEIYAGGPATNAAITFSHLGGSATMAAAVGCHPVSSIVREQLRVYGVELIDLSPELYEPPAISSVAVDKTGQRNVISVNATRVASLSTSVNLALLDQASIVLVDGHSMDACCAWAHAAKARGVPVVFDGGSWKPGTDQLLESVAIAVCSSDFHPPGCTRKEDTFRFLRASGVESIAITRGPEPIRFMTSSRKGSVPVPHVRPVDTMGAGDIFHGAFCYFLSVGQDFQSALAEASRIASWSCCFPGTREWMGTMPPSSNLSL